MFSSLHSTGSSSQVSSPSGHLQASLIIYSNPFSFLTKILTVVPSFNKYQPSIQLKGKFESGSQAYIGASQVVHAFFPLSNNPKILLLHEHSGAGYLVEISP